MTSRGESSGVRVSRRELGRIAAGAVAGALAGASANAKPAPSQGQPRPEVPMPDTDSRLALIEQSRGKPLTEEQRKAVLKNIKSTEESWAKGRAFPVPDGTEPDFIFRPTPSQRQGGKFHG